MGNADKIIRSENIQFDKAEIILSEGGCFSFSVGFPGRECDANIGMDLYDLDDRSHPDGHVGWWEYSIKDKEMICDCQIIYEDGIYRIDMKNSTLCASWLNENVPVTNRLMVIIGVKQPGAGSVLMERQLPVFFDRRICQEYRSTAIQPFIDAPYADKWYLPLVDGVVRIISRNIYTKDAVGEFCLSIIFLLKKNGISVEMYAENYELAIEDQVKRINALQDDISPNDIIFYFYSTYDASLEDILCCHAKQKIIYFHGVTRPELLRKYDLELYETCKIAYDQLAILERFDAFAANSNATACELSSVAGINVDSVDIIAPQIVGTEMPTKRVAKSLNRNVKLLYVGRIKAHKRIDDLLKFFSFYLRYDKNAELVIVGRPEGEYKKYLDEVQGKLFKDNAERVKWLGSVSRSELATIYDAADAYISMSEDEGFCLPVFEAMRAGIPVFAYGVPAVIEVLGKSGCYFIEKDFEYLAKNISSILNDCKKRESIIEKQLCRADQLARDMDGSAILGLLEGALTQIRPNFHAT